MYHIRRNAMLLLSLILLFLQASARSTPSKQSRPTGTLAVLSFDSGPRDKQLGVVVSEIIRSEIASLSDNPYVVVERAMLDKVIREQELSMTGIVDDSVAARVGKILYADHLVVGKVIFLGKEIRIQARIIETASSAIKKEASETIYSRDDLSGAAKSVAYRLFGKNYTFEKTPHLKDRRSAPPNEPTAVKEPSDLDLRETYTSVYTDSRGIHRGGIIRLTRSGDRITGYTIEDIGRADMTGTIEENRITGYYKGKYGYGTFTFRIFNGGQYLAGNYYQVSNGAHGEWLASRGKRFVMPPALFTNKWKPGNRCLSKWSGDSFWYPARITSMKDGLYHVQYDDGDREWRLEKNLRREQLRRGDIVFGNWKGKGKYYRGIIARRNGRQIYIHYDDGDREWSTISRIRVMFPQ